ncbi:MAG: YifB family Mg chelatase-like AAA ATPase [Candidatus Andersenbacteria bacterium]|nr:YifB family Mg chelatase-like AAA ATPase [Candidatus Andersenbacteria bacterium]
MPARVVTAALRGIDAIPVAVEVDVLAGLPSFTVVGLGDKTIQESRQRLTAALTHIGYTPPRRKTIVSLAPASLRKEGSLYDLPITLGFLIASKQIAPTPRSVGDGAWFAGEVGLDGSIRPVHGVLPIVLAAARAGIGELYIPAGNAAEASAVADQLKIYAVNSLPELIAHLTVSAISPLDKGGTGGISSPHNGVLQPLTPRDFPLDFPEPEIDFADIKGQEHAKRALLIAAASSHHVLLVGPPGTGKTLLARALAGILPPLTRQESHTVTSLYSVAGELAPGSGLIRRRPYRSPHHGASSVALVGGGSYPKPGEISLAHSGVLFLDELPEFPRAALDQLRQPIEDGKVTVSRAAHTVQFPARPILVGAMNPCPCGFLGSMRKECRCPRGTIIRYQRRISGPLLDRFDLHVLVADIPLKALLNGQGSSSAEKGSLAAGGQLSAHLAEQATAARDKANQRQGKTNAELTPREIRRICRIDSQAEKLLYQAETRFHLSGRGIHRLLKVARTIADLNSADDIHITHLAEALQYREQLQQALPEFV